MAKMDKSDLQAMLSGLKASSMSAVAASRLSKERSDAMDFYLGDMSKVMPAQEGRSQAVSSDVADCVEGLMPDLMEIFAATDEVVQFNPVGPEDIAAAEQETEYVNHVFMQQNPGFLVLYSFIKDALLSKVGVVKVWWEEREEEQNETYYNLTADEFAFISNDPEVEVTEHSEIKDPLTGQPLHDVKITKRQTIGEAKILGVPPEEFGIEPNARSVPSSNYCYHKVYKTEGELIAQGYDKRQVAELPTYTAITNTEETSRSSVGENTEKSDQGFNKSARQIEVTEHYVRMDYKGDGVACLYRVVTSENEEVLKRDGDPDIMEWDIMPFAAMSPVIVTHRFFGRSIADLVMDIQKIKTALIRAQLDNAYIANNPRVEVAESFASEETIDDLLISRHGGIIRTKNPGGIQWQNVPTIGGHVFPLMEYMDQQREMRTGVTKQGMGIDAEVLQNQSATAVSHVFSMAQAKMRLIARIFAETGIKDLFLLLHGVIRKHGSQPQVVRLRNQWVAVDPRDWKKRNDMTINVGLGASGRQQQMAQVQALAMFQEKALAGGLTNLVNASNLYNTAKLLCKGIGEKDCTQYFTDPATQPPPQQAPDPKLIEIQLKAEIEKLQAQADITTQNNKTQAEMALAQQKFELDKQLAILDAGIKVKEHETSLAHEQQKAVMDMQMKAQQHEQQMQVAQTKAATQKSGQAKASIEVKHDAGQVTGPIGEAIDKLGQHITQTHAAIAQHQQTQTQMIAAALKHVGAPRRVVRDKNNRITHTEVVS